MPIVYVTREKLYPRELGPGFGPAAKVRGPQNVPMLQRVIYQGGRFDRVSEENRDTEHSQTEVREHLANERTLLSWVRTGVSLISLGLVVERAGALAKAADFQLGSTSGSDFFGLGLALLGALTLILGTTQFLRNRRAIAAGKFESSVTVYLIIVIGSLLFAGAFTFYVLFS
jgi:putative membrane protein